MNMGNEDMNEEWYEEKDVVVGTHFLQLRQNSGKNTLHIQAYGTNLDNCNRPYGYADKFSVPPIVANTVNELEEPLFNSLASESKVYMRNLLEVHQYDDGSQLHINIVADNNNGHGCYILDLPLHRFGKLIKFLQDNQLITNHEGELRFIQESNGEEE